MFNTQLLGYNKIKPLWTKYHKFLNPTKVSSKEVRNHYSIKTSKLKMLVITF